MNSLQIIFFCTFILSVFSANVDQPDDESKPKPFRIRLGLKGIGVDIGGRQIGINNGGKAGTDHAIGINFGGKGGNRNAIGINFGQKGGNYGGVGINIGGKGGNHGRFIGINIGKSDGARGIGIDIGKLLGEKENNNQVKSDKKSVV